MNAEYTTVNNRRVTQGNRQTGISSPTPSQQTGTPPDQFSLVVQRARAVLAKTQSGLLPKAATNTATNTNTKNLDRTIGDLVQRVETTTDPVWKETWRVALVRLLNAVEKANAGGREPVNSKAAATPPDTFSHPGVGFSRADVSNFSARQAVYQQRFNPPAAPDPAPSLPLDPLANGNEYRNLDIPGLGTTAIPTQTNPKGSFFQGPRGKKPIGTSHR